MSPIYHDTRQSIPLSVYKMLEHTNLKNYKSGAPLGSATILPYKVDVVLRVRYPPQAPPMPYKYIYILYIDRDTIQQ